MDRGIETVMMMVLRQLPIKSRTRQSGQRSRDDAFTDHAADRVQHEGRLIGEGVISCIQGRDQCSARE